MFARPIAVCVVALVIPLCGCSPMSVIKQAYHEVRGAQSELLWSREVTRGQLEHIQSVNFASPTTDLGERICPRVVVTRYDESLRRLGADLDDVYAGGSPELRITTELLYFQTKGLMSEAELLARVRFYSGGTPIGDAIVRTESKSFRAGDEAALAQSSVEALGKFLHESRRGGD